jgi:hypothetical protein
MERMSYIVVMAYCCMSGVTDKKYNQSPVQDFNPGSPEYYTGAQKN